MPSDPRAAVRSAAIELVRTLSGQALPPAVPVTEAEGWLACMVVGWEAGRLMPTLAGERQARQGGERAGCRKDVLAAVTAAGRPLTRKQVLKALREAGTRHGPGTVAKALAELTESGESVNPRAKKGYRLPDWPRPSRTPSLFA